VNARDRGGMRSLLPLALGAGIALFPGPVTAQSWTYLGLGGHVVLSLQSHGSNLYAGTNHGFFTKVREGVDTTWTRLSLAAYEVKDFVIVDDQTFVATRYDPNTDHSVLIRSTDGGTNWTTVYSPPVYFADLEMRPGLSDTIFACSSGAGQISKSVNRGVTWSPLPAPSMVLNRVVISPQDPTHLLAGGEDFFFQSRLFESINGGASWVSRPSLGSPGGDNAVNAIAFDPTDQSRIHLGMEDYTGLSTDGGASWSFLNFPSGGGSWYSFDVVVDPLQPSRVFYMAQDFNGASPLHLAISENSGATWNLLTFSPGYGHGEAQDLELVLENGSTVVYFGGRGVYRIGPFAVSASPENQPGALKVSLAPAFLRNGRLTIPYQVAEAGTSVSLRLFDIQGRSIYQFPTAIQNAGNYEIEWSGTGNQGGVITPGIYFVRLFTNGFTASEKIFWPGK
jgi:hypothetical protein